MEFYYNNRALFIKFTERKKIISKKGKLAKGTKSKNIKTPKK